MLLLLVDLKHNCDLMSKKVYKMLKKFKLVKKINNRLYMEIASSKKERSDMILEPLQVMMQLAILGYCPTGTKISINENTLILQRPSWVQGVLRWYGRDCREDLYYLFHAIRRFYLWYKKEDSIIYNYILKRSKHGISKLMETYNTERSSLTHTLGLYKNILDFDTPDLFKTEESEAINMDSVFKNIINIYIPL